MTSQHSMQTQAQSCTVKLDLFLNVHYLGSSMKGGDSHEGDDGGAVGVGNDTPLPIPHTLHSFWVHLRNY